MQITFMHVLHKNKLKCSGSADGCRRGGKRKRTVCVCIPAHTILSEFGEVEWFHARGMEPNVERKSKRHTFIFG